MNTIDTDRLRESVNNFNFYSLPSISDSDQPCTVGDLKKVIDNTAKLFNSFIDEIENQN